MRRALFAALLLVGAALAAQPGVGHALLLTEKGPLVGGEARGHPFVELLGNERWQGEGRGAVLALAPGLWAGRYQGDAALAFTDEAGVPKQILRFGGPLPETAVALAKTQRGVLLAGYAAGHFFGKNHGGEDIFLAWVEGGRLARSLTWGTDDDDALTAMALAPDGSIYLAGYQMTNEDCIRVSERGFVLKFSKTGRLLWSYRFGFEASSRPTALLASEEGLWVAGNTDGPLFGAHAGGDDVFLLLLAPDGRAAIQTQWGSDRTDLAKKLRRAKGRLWLLGESAGGGNGFAPFLARLDARGRPETQVPVPIQKETHAADLAIENGTFWVLLNTEDGFAVVRLQEPLR